MPRPTPSQALDQLAEWINAHPTEVSDETLTPLMQQPGHTAARRTLQRRLALLVEQERIGVRGEGRATRYHRLPQPGASAQTVQTEANALQNKRNAVQQELARLQQRVTLATAYVEEQVGMKLNDAIKSAMKTQKVDLVIQPGAVVAREPYVDITPAIIAELNKMVPSASITPPAGWQPGQAEQAQQQAAPAATPAQQPSGR